MALIPYQKQPRTYDEQVDLLLRRGMVVGDRSRAVKALQRISYYRLSAYWYPFRQPADRFEPGTKFETALGLYEYDRRLRLAVLDAIERAEVHARTIITYEFAHNSGAFVHVDARNSARPSSLEREDLWWLRANADSGANASNPARSNAPMRFMVPLQMVRDTPWRARLLQSKRARPSVGRPRAKVRSRCQRGAREEA